MSSRVGGAAASGGFTLLELLVTMAIVSILAVVALPAYSGYVLRSKVSEGIGLLGPIKPQMVEQYYSDGAWPADNADAALGLPSDYRAGHVASVTVLAGGILEVAYSIPELGANNLLQLVPCADGATVVWSCRAPSGNGVAADYLPSSCKTLAGVSACPAAIAANDAGAGASGSGDNGGGTGTGTGTGNGTGNGNGNGNGNARRNANRAAVAGPGRG